MSGSTGLSPLQSYLSYSSNETKYVDASAASNGTETALIAYFQKQAPAIKSPSALLGDYKALSLVLGAFNLSGSINDTALLKQLLTQDPKSKTSLAQRLGNAKYLSFATALSTWTPPPFSSASSIAALVKAYKTNQFEAGADKQTPGLQKALYFTRQAGAIKTYTQLQSDADLLAVAVTGIGLPLTAYENLSFQQQSALLKQKLNIADLQKPAFVQHLAEFYMVQQQLNAPQTASAPAAGSLLALFPGSGADTSGDSVLSILQSAAGGTSSLLGGGTSNNVLSLFA